MIDKHKIEQAVQRVISQYGRVLGALPMYDQGIPEADIKHYLKTGELPKKKGGKLSAE